MGDEENESQIIYKLANENMSRDVKNTRIAKAKRSEKLTTEKP